MQELVRNIQSEARYVGNGIVKLDSFLNHQVDAGLTFRMGQEFVRQFTEKGVSGVTKVISAEVSGIPAALFTAQLLDVPMLFARKHRSAVMTDDYFTARTKSRTKGNEVDLMISKQFLDARDKVLVIDDFLATGNTLHALCSLIHESRAELAGIGCVIEKPQEQGRARFHELGVPIVTLAKVSFDDDSLVVSD